MATVVGDEVTIRYRPDQSTLSVTGTVIAVSESKVTVNTGVEFRDFEVTEDVNAVIILKSDIVETKRLNRRVDILEALSDWIDTDVIAESIADHLEEELGEKLTLRGCKEVWLRELQNLLN